MSSVDTSPSRLFYIAIYYRSANSDDSKSADKSIRLAQVSNFAAFNFFARSTAGDAIRFGARTVINRIPLGCRHSVSSGDAAAPFMIHAYVRHDGLGCAIVTDENYDKRVAFVLVNKELTQYEKDHSSTVHWKSLNKDLDSQPEFLKADLKTYENPKDADLLIKINSQVQAVKGLVQQSIHQVLANGETIDGLVDKSDDLDNQSKKFLKQAKKANSCCRLY